MSLTNTWKNSLAQSLVFIDSNVNDYQFLADNLNKNVAVFILDSARNGIEQINEAIQKIASRQGLIEAIQIFSHGSPGSLQLGNSFLNGGNLEAYGQLLSSWKNTLTNKANILLYGCEVAADIGAEFVCKLQEIIGVNIAASVNLTGSSKLGGNWDLEFTTGEILVPIALTEIAQENYPGVLATLTVRNNNDSGAGSLREAIATAEAGDTIKFNSSLANQTITLSSGQLDIDKDLIIDGGDAAGLTISGNNASRVFFVNKVPIVNEPVNATFKNLKIADGKTDGVGEEGAGAAIRTISRSILTVENLEFENNVANGEGGGAIYAGSRTTTTVLNSKFNGNKAFGNGESGKSERGGGAIAVNGFGLLSISDSEFTNNEGINGGAINVVRTELSVENSTFINNDSTSGGVFGPDTFGYGGAIYTDGASSSREEIVPGNITIRNSRFDSNQGAGQGGGLFLFGYEGDVVTVENSTIINNSVIEDTNNFALGGGIRHGSNSELIVTNSVFANNSAIGGQGGGLWSDSATDIVNTTFSGNKALSSDNNAGLGGAITLANKGKPSRITNVTVAFNTAEFQGGGIWANDSATTLTNTVFAGNIAENDGKGFNVFHNTNFEFQDGGGNLDFNALNPDDTRITANALLVDPQLEPLQEINGVLVHPLGAGSPAIDAGTNTNAPTTDQRGQQRPVDGDGNGTQIIDIGAYEFVNEALPSTVVTNTNDSGPGSLRQAIATAVAGDTIIFDSSLANQTITLSSGQLEIDKDLIIDGADAAGLTISGNNASRIFDVQFQKVFTLKNLKMLDGRTTQTGIEGNGGAINTSSQVTLTIENSEFLNNVTAGEGGGAISAGHKSNTTIINSKFDGNDATLGESERGGGAIITNGFASLTIKNSEFTNNKGINGGAINTPSTALTVENSTFINNDTTVGASISSSSSSPRGFGGAIYTDGVSASFGGDNGSIIIRDSLFDGNKGAGSGGAAFLFTYPGDNVIIENTRVLNNSVIFNQIEQAYGGGIRLGTGQSSIDRTTPVQYDITNTTFAGNTAESQGGGLWIDRKLDLTKVDIVNSTFSENKAENPDGSVGLGGAIATFAPTTITNSTIANNHAAELSGAIYTTETTGFTPDIEVTNTIFNSNTAANENGTDQQTNIQLIDGGGNLQFPGVGGNAEELVTENITIADPQLGELQEVDGALVRPLQAGSPAIDAGTNTNAPTTDQRGQQRPVDGDGNGSEVTDIGAYELVDNTVPENNPPTVANNRTLTLNEGATSTITTNRLQVTDADGDPITFNINELPNNGTLKLNNTNLTASDTFSQTDIDNGNLSYSHNGSETTRDSFSLSARDGSGGSTGNIDVNLRVNAVNDRPSNINIDNNRIVENSDSGAVIGTISTADADGTDTHTYTLVNDGGGRFTIEGDRLVVADGSKLDFESNRRHNITVQTTDSGTPSQSFEKQLTIRVTDVEENNPPTNIVIDNNNITENSDTGTVIGQLSTADADGGDTHTYTLVDDGGGRFTIEGDRLVVADGSKLDFESNRRHNITVQTTDSGTPSQSFEKQLTIRVTDVEENNSPTNIVIDNNNITENSDSGAVIGTISTADADGTDTHTYTLVDDGGGRFTIEGDRLVVADGSKLDFETNRRHNITVQTTDSGTPSQSFEKQLTIRVTDVEEGPPALNLRGTENDDRLVGGAGRDTLSGAGGSDTLNGQDGNDVLDGGRGQDLMRGGPGNDLYLVDNSGDQIVENIDEGKDSVKSSVTHSLGDNLERLVLTGSDNIDGTGNPIDNPIAGNDANNKLVGAAGNDTIWGVGGRDTLIGSRGHDILLGGSGNDLLAGGMGRDRLNGNAGNDTLVGGVGIDTFIFNTNEEFAREDLGTDVIADFKRVHGDKILLDRRTFSAITSNKGDGFSVGSEFETVDSDAAAAASDAVVVYDRTNGNLFYNPNGSNNGLGSGGLFATLTDAPTLAESDFLIR